ncbi:restriction endonuclease subunit S [Sphingomonas japonica]|uniref:Type I restriction enzyme S subunit n=1 Tax=Sphingomonas japonica TaxID=511662 RepID=A0ABX0U4P7_9SPHN|nr:restriction endonuclease subunit S [Sphingomonas japonica]NIJ24636.1 type I restriction enzyme S subunit [Sphingomonas japonica]
MIAWPTVALKDCVRVVGGATPKSGVAEFWDGDVPWTTPKDLSDLSGKFLSDTPRKITASGLKGCSAELLPPNSVLFSSRAPIGHVAINTVPMATNQGFKSMVPGPRIDASYLYWWLKSNRAQLELLGNGATFKEVSKAIVERIEIPLPPLVEQKRIAAILDQADDLRRKRQRTIERLNQLGQSIFHEMFGDAVTNPMGWKTALLGDIVRSGDKINYGVVQPGEEVEVGIPLVRVGDLLSGYIDPRKVKQIDPDIEANYKRSRLAGDEILIGCVGSIGTVALAHEGLRGANIARAVARVPVDTNVATREFVAEQIKSPAVQNYFAAETRTVAQPTLNIGLIVSAPIILPPISDQRKFADRNSVVRETLVSLIKHAAKQDALLSSLQHRAFLGEL